MDRVQDLGKPSRQQTRFLQASDEACILVFDATEPHRAGIHGTLVCHARVLVWWLSGWGANSRQPQDFPSFLSELSVHRLAWASGRDTNSSTRNMARKILNTRRDGRCHCVVRGFLTSVSLVKSQSALCRCTPPDKFPSSASGVISDVAPTTESKSAGPSHSLSLPRISGYSGRPFGSVLKRTHTEVLSMV